MIKYLLALTILTGALTSCSTETTESTPNVETTTSEEAPRAHVVVEAGVTDLQAFVAEHYAKAKAENLKPCVYFTADWCPPCKAIHKFRYNDQMVDAHAGVYLIEVDIDVHSGTMDAYPFVSSIPQWTGINEDGSSDGHLIDGGAWADNVPENMAPALKEYFAAL